MSSVNICYKQDTEFNPCHYDDAQTVYLMPTDLWFKSCFYDQTCRIKLNTCLPFLLWVEQHGFNQNSSYHSPIETYIIHQLELGKFTKKTQKPKLSKGKKNTIVIWHAQCLSKTEHAFLNKIPCKHVHLFQTTLKNNHALNACSFHLLDDTTSELSFMIKTIRNLETNYQNISILYPHYHPKNQLTQKLNAFNVAYKLIETNDFSDCAFKTELIFYLASKFLENNLLIAHALCYPKKGIGEKMVKNWMHAATNEGVSFVDYLRQNQLSFTPRQQGILDMFFKKIDLTSKKSPQDFIEEQLCLRQDSEHNTLKSFLTLLNCLPKKYHLKSCLFWTMQLLSNAPNGVTCLDWDMCYQINTKYVFILGVETLDPQTSSQLEPILSFAKQSQTVCLTGACKREINLETCLTDLYPNLNSLGQNNLFVEKEALQNLSAKLLMKQFPKTRILENIKPRFSAEDIDIKLSIGQFIHHDQWGKGHIIDISTINESKIYTIDFNKEIKKINAKYSSLRLV